MLSLPLPFIEQTKTLLRSGWEVFEQALQQDAPVSIRLNNKIKPGLSYRRVPWCEAGYYLPERPLFTADPLFHAGGYYVQEAGSMFIEQIIKQHVTHPVNALDLCAAPGGKSTHLSNLLPEGSFLVANETIRQRSHILAENMQKWGNPDVAVTNNTAADFGKQKAIFDLIVADVPCSGEGMFRKDPASIEEWSPANVELCATRQQSIINDVWPALKEGGLLIYSTCTYNRSEDENNIEWIVTELGAEVLPVNINPEWQITESNGCYRFFPHKTESEGFFIAALRKTASPESVLKHNKNHNDSRSRQSLLKPDTFSNYLTGQEWFYRKDKTYIYAYHKQFDEIVSIINAHLNPLFTGITLGELKGTDFIPHTALALSKSLNTNHVSSAEVDWATAISYLKREAILLSDSPKGYILLTYNNLSLGWVKNVGSRANNLYPTEWRIRMALDTKTIRESPLLPNSL
jgi:16S rRNA C967 or C1407 C5-methylase (RsmB/RsmF family)/NOL1/NOP2/fmu family ribosome biogenesis protein